MSRWIQVPGVAMVAVGLLAAVVTGVNRSVRRAADGRIHDGLLAAEKIVDMTQRSRLEALRAATNVLAESPRLQALLSTPGLDHATLFDGARSAQQAIGSDLLMFADARGRLLASATEPTPSGESVAEHPAFATALHGKRFEGGWVTATGIYQVVASPVVVGGRVVGAVLDGLALAHKTAEDLAAATHCQVALMSPQHLIASSSWAEDFFARFRQAHPAMVMQRQGRIMMQTHEGRRYAVAVAPLFDEQAVYLLVRAVDEEVLFYQQFQQAMLVIGISVLLAVLILGRLWMRTPSPRRMSAGDGTRLRVTGNATGLHPVLDTLLQAMFDAVAVVTPQGTIGMVNPALCQLFGSPSEELLGQPMTKFFTTEEALQSPGSVDETFRYGSRAQPVKMRGVAKNGDQIPVLVFSCVDGPADATRGVICVIRDLRERLNEVALSQAYKKLAVKHHDLLDLVSKLKHQDEAWQSLQSQSAWAAKPDTIDQLVRGLGQEVQNPLATLMQGLDYLQRELHPTPSLPVDIFQIMREAVMRVDAVTRGLLRISKASSPEVRPTAISQVLEAAVKVVQEQAPMPQVRVIKEMSEGLPPVMIDEPHMRQAFVNVILNAVQAMPNGGRLHIRAYAKQLTEPLVPFGPRAADALRVGETVLICEIADTGLGIPKEQQPRVFDLFFTTKPSGDGVGLGLPIARAIIEGHGGLLTIDSTEGQGTTATVTLPMGTSESRPVKKRILLIDDDVALCKMVKLNLERAEGYDVTTAYLGHEGLEKADAFQFDLVISDFKMPDMDGIAVLDALKARKPHLPVLLFSIYHDHSATITTDMRNKADGIIGKPINHQQLHQAIANALAKSEAQDT